MLIEYLDSRKSTNLKYDALMLEVCRGGGNSTPVAAVAKFKSDVEDYARALAAIPFPEDIPIPPYIPGYVPIDNPKLIVELAAAIAVGMVVLADDATVVGVADDVPYFTYILRLLSQFGKNGRPIPPGVLPAF